jgi:hypothetical protein
MNNMIVVRVISSNPIKDKELLKEIINCYASDDFEKMIYSIDDYGKSFFFDLWRFLDEQTYRSVLNKYMIFVQITLQYHKEYIKEG